MTYRPYVPGSNTSLAAAASQSGKAEVDEARVLDHIRACGPLGATDDEIEVALHLLHQTASARRRGLVLKDFVVDSGRVRLTRSKRFATVWIATTADEPEASEPAAPETKPLCAHGEERGACVLCRTRR